LGNATTINTEFLISSTSDKFRLLYKGKKEFLEKLEFKCFLESKNNPLYTDHVCMGDIPSAPRALGKPFTDLIRNTFASREIPVFKAILAYNKVHFT
jgi:hypothetical protein